jgi:hypothetical protein
LVFVTPTHWTTLIETKYLVNCRCRSLLQYQNFTSHRAYLLLVGRVLELFVPLVALTLTRIHTAIGACT